MAGRPLVGVVCCARRMGDEIAHAVSERYLDAVMRYAQCAVVLVPACPELMQAADVADRIDGLLLTGSPSNIAPARYGQPGADAAPSDPARDAMSLALIAAMVGRGRPIFGICRGFQELNVAFGGSLARDLGDPGRSLPHHAAIGVSFEAMFDHRHEVALTTGGVLAMALKRKRLDVNSVHFQGIDRLGTGLTVEATAADGVVEAVSAEVNGAAILGVQWHPEWHTEQDPASIGTFQIFGRALRSGTNGHEDSTI